MLTITKALINRKYIKKPGTPSKLFQIDFQNNFCPLKKNKYSIQIINELWKRASQNLKKLYEEKFRRLNLEYEYMQIVKKYHDKIILDKIRPHTRYGDIVIEYYRDIKKDNKISDDNYKEYFNLLYSRNKNLNNFIIFILMY